MVWQTYSLVKISHSHLALARGFVAASRSRLQHLDLEERKPSRHWQLALRSWCHGSPALNWNSTAKCCFAITSEDERALRRGPSSFDDERLIDRAQPPEMHGLVAAAAVRSQGVLHSTHSFSGCCSIPCIRPVAAVHPDVCRNSSAGQGFELLPLREGRVLSRCPLVRSGDSAEACIAITSASIPIIARPVSKYLG